MKEQSKNSEPLISKTQISHLRSGTKNQMLNKQVDYRSLPQTTSHIGHAGTNHALVNETWAKVVGENPNSLKIAIAGNELLLELIPCRSVSGKSVAYLCFISPSLLECVFSLKAAKDTQAYISISGAAEILVSNGKKSFIHVCPSLITIL